MYKVLIRPLTIEDASTSYHWRNDSEVWKYTGNRPNIEITEEIERNWIVDKLNETNSKRFAIEVDDVYVGNIQLTSITKSEAEFHIFIGNKDYWGKGIAYSAIQQILRYADYILKLNKVYLKVNPEHEKAIKLYERCGFIKVDESVSMKINLKERNKPTVSIFSMVYNHEFFLEQCLDSFLMQKCLFDFEIVVGEDFSKDKSRDILLRYQSKYPGKFKLLLHDKNIGAVNNQDLTLRACNGEYIALCEGDDYWTDPYKLQKQADFLEANPSYFGVCTNLYLHNHKTDSRTIHNRIPETIEYIDTALQLQENYINTCTFMFKSKVLDFLLKHPAETILDTTLFTYTTLYGHIGYLPEPMANYNQFVGVHHRQKKSELVELNLKILKDLEVYAPLKITDKTFAKLSKRKLYFRATVAYAQENNLTEAIRYYAKYITLLPIGLAFSFSSKNVSKITLKMKYSLLLNMLSSIKRKVIAGK